MFPYLPIDKARHLHMICVVASGSKLAFHADRQNVAAANHRAAEAARDARAARLQAESATKAQQALDIRIQQLEAKLLQLLERPTPTTRKAALFTARFTCGHPLFTLSCEQQVKESQSG
jgi:hypothetical protein